MVGLRRAVAISAFAVALLLASCSSSFTPHPNDMVIGTTWVRVQSGVSPTGQTWRLWRTGNNTGGPCLYFEFAPPQAPLPNQHLLNGADCGPRANLSSPLGALTVFVAGTYLPSLAAYSFGYTVDPGVTQVEAAIVDGPTVTAPVVSGTYVLFAPAGSQFSTFLLKDGTRTVSECGLLSGGAPRAVCRRLR
jgi:hypothetical protein